MTSVLQAFALCLILGLLGYEVNGHGMVLDPPNRSSMWRYGHSEYPINYNDNANFCGGYNVHWAVHEGRCGLCGDDFGLPQPRPNEHGGFYGLGVIGREYEEESVISAFVDITVSHKGYFTFHICNMDLEHESEECFDKYPLRFADGSDKFYPDSVARNYTVDLQIPTGLVCQHCVLRWNYKAGNNWGQCEDGTSAIGCGKQETFRTCSDIAIRSSSRRKYVRKHPLFSTRRPEKARGGQRRPEKNVDERKNLKTNCQ